MQERNKILQEKLENQSLQLDSERQKNYELKKRNEALVKEKIELQQELQAIYTSEEKLKCKIAHIRTIVDEESEEHSTSQQTHKLSNVISKGLKRMSSMSFGKSK